MNTDGIANPNAEVRGGEALASIAQNSIRQHFDRFSELMRLRQFAEAVVHVVAIADQCPTVITKQDFISLALTLSQENQIELALHVLSKGVRNNPLDLELKLAKVDMLLAAGSLRSAELEYKVIEENYPKLLAQSNSLHVMCSVAGKAAYRGLLHSELKSRLIGASLLNSDDVGKEIVEQGILATFHAEMGDFLSADKAYEQILTARPDCLSMAHDYCRLLVYWGKIAKRGDLLSKAIHLMVKWLGCFPNWGQGYLFLAQVLSEDLVNFQEGYGYFRLAIECDPSNEEAQKGAAFSRARLKGWDSDALQHATQYLDIIEKRQQAHAIGREKIRYLGWVATYAFGHLSSLPDIIHRARSLNEIDDYKVTIVAPHQLVANPALLDMWREHFNVVTELSQLKGVEKIVRDLTLETSLYRFKDKKILHNQAARAYVLKRWHAQHEDPPLKIRESHAIQARQLLSKFGMKPDDWFVCLHMKEPGFKQEANQGFYKHQFVDPMTYHLAINEIVARGGWVVRLGESSMSRLPQMNRVIDYAHSDIKSDWMDIYLLSSCRFYLMSNSGSYGTSLLFHVPIIFTNANIFIPISEGANCLSIFKKVIDSNSKAPITFKEVFESRFYMNEQTEDIYAHGWDFQDNSPEEIRDVVIEMFDRVDGKYRVNPESEELQKRFLNFIPADKRNDMLIKLGDSWLRSLSALVQ